MRRLKCLKVHHPSNSRGCDSQAARTRVPDVVPLRMLTPRLVGRPGRGSHSLSTIWITSTVAPHGLSTMAAQYGFPGGKKGPFRSIVAPFLGAFVSEELAKRRKEWAEVTKAMLQCTLGDTAKDMIEVQGLVTAPKKQGRGYGTVLMRFVNALADAQNRGVYIFTTDAYGFYQSVGYSILQEAVVGADNPKWNGDPVHIKLMYRKPRART
ncbi:hypothetical protein GY45DRAFT_810945 [Cubamyces sp. BRFM 1775]|nr:hypothetical protein GY45DRAFT_810945 [Cubamyces sp. BRFM 1775]